MFAKIINACLFLMIISAGFSQESDFTYRPNEVKDSTKRSIKARAVGMINGDSVTVDYYSPAVRGRIIWGGLVPFGEVWVTGAHNATAIDFPKDIQIAGTTLRAGRYGFFTIPAKEEWIIILNKNWDQHLADDYDAKDDMLRVMVKPQKNEHTERLEYFIVPGKDSGGAIVVTWEKLRIELPFTLNK